MVFGIFIIAFVFQSISLKSDHKLKEVLVGKNAETQEQQEPQEPELKKALVASEDPLPVPVAFKADLVTLQGIENIRNLLNSDYRVFVMLDNSVLDEKIYEERGMFLTEVYLVQKMIFTTKGGVRHGDDTAYFFEDFKAAFEAVDKQGLILTQS